METPLPNDYLASNSPPVGGCLHSFRKDWQREKCSNNVLHSILKPKLARVPLIHSGYKAHQKDLARASCMQPLLCKDAVERVENVKSLGFLSPVSSPQVSPKVEASHRSQQAQHLSGSRKVQIGNTR